MYWDKSFQRCTRFRTHNADRSLSDDHRHATGKIVTFFYYLKWPVFLLVKMVKCETSSGVESNNDNDLNVAVLFFFF